MPDKLTNVDKYNPTTAEKKLLEVLLDPKSVNMSITNICKKAKVSRQTYYDATEKEQFNDLVKDSALDMIKAKVGPLMNATYKYALEERGHQDRKMLFNMLGMYSDKVDQNINANVNELDLSDISTDDLKELIKDEKEK